MRRNKQCLLMGIMKRSKKISVDPHKNLLVNHEDRAASHRKIYAFEQKKRLKKQMFSHTYKIDDERSIS